MEKPYSENNTDPSNFIHFRMAPESKHSPNDLVLRRAYICRRKLNIIPFMFDLLAHSAILFDAYTTEQTQAVNATGTPEGPPVARFMFERYEDQIHPATKKAQPHTAIREVDIGEPYRFWYQAAPPAPQTGTPTASWYQIDTRSYEFFDLDGYYWTKQVRGKEVNVKLHDLQQLAQDLIQDSYDIGRHTCHDAQEAVMIALGVEKGDPRPISRILNALRPVISKIK